MVARINRYKLTVNCLAVLGKIHRYKISWESDQYLVEVGTCVQTDGHGPGAILICPPHWQEGTYILSLYILALTARNSSNHVKGVLGSSTLIVLYTLQHILYYLRCTVTRTSNYNIFVLNLYRRKYWSVKIITNGIPLWHMKSTMVVESLSHNYIYMSLLLATYFDFCEKPLSGK
jgi:hypothetical protein